MGILFLQKIRAVRPKILVYFAVFAFYLVKTDYYIHHVPYRIPPDELAHYSYVMHMKEFPALVPDYENMRIYRSGVWSEYLSLAHPPLYYLLMAGLAGHDVSDTENKVQQLRHYNLILSGLALIFFLAVGFSMPWPLLPHLLYAVAVTSVPMLGFLGAAVNNDNLAIVGGAITVFALLRYLRGQRSFWLLQLLGLGFFVSAMAKLTAGILSGFMIAWVFLILAWREKNRAYVWRSWLGYQFCWYAAVAAFFGLVYLKYGTLVPAPNNPPPHVWEDRFGFFSYLVYFFKARLWDSYANIHAHWSLAKQHALEMLALFLMPVLAVLQFFRGKFSNPAVAVFFRAGMLALLGLLLINISEAWKSHLATGDRASVQARYYFPLLPVMALGFVVYLEKLPGRWYKTLLIVLLVASFIYSDFVYFMCSSRPF